MAYKYGNSFDAEKEVKDLKGSIATIRAALKHNAEAAKKVRSAPSAPPKYVTDLEAEVVSVRDSNARIRARIRKLEDTIEKQATQIEQLQGMVAQLIERGRIPCQDSSHSSSPQRQSLRLASSS